MNPLSRLNDYAAPCIPDDLSRVATWVEQFSHVIGWYEYRLAHGDPLVHDSIVEGYALWREARAERMVEAP